MNKLVFIGPCGGGKIPTNGASVKNFYLIQTLREKFNSVTVIDTEYWKKNPFVLLKLLFVILVNFRAKFIISANNMSSYRLIRIFYAIPVKREVYYWVIGGSIAKWIKVGKVKSAPYRVLKMFIVEGNSMKETLNECGFDNVVTVPNFKNITYIPDKHISANGDKTDFVFLSRIIPQKGCDYIIEAVKILNSKYSERFSVDFYGEIADDYRDAFLDKVNSLPNVSYKGFLDLRNPQNYDILSRYDSMLFPTFWDGEGFPGIIIDAYIAGLPVIATDWSLNRDILKDGHTGLFVSPRNASALAIAMQKLIEISQDEIAIMACNCQHEAVKFDIKHVLSTKLLQNIGLQ